jgi:hypothetical protein
VLERRDGKVVEKSEIKTQGTRAEPRHEAKKP